MPTTRSGFTHARAIDAMDNEEVFEAMIASPDMTDESAANSFCLADKIFNDRLDHQTTAREHRVIVREWLFRELNAFEKCIACCSVELAFLDQFPKPRSDACARARRCLRLGIDEYYAVSGSRGNLRDAATHCSRSDNPDGRAAGHHRPVKIGLRFSMNAVTPSA